MQLTKQQVGYIVASVIGVLAIALVTLLLVNVRRANQPLSDVQDLMEESRDRIARSEQTCAQAQDPDICYRQSVTEEAELLGDVSLCEVLDTAAREACAERVALGTNDRDLCRHAAQDRRNPCEDTIAFAIAREQQDIRLCDGIQDETVAETCRSSVTSEIVAAGTCSQHGVQEELCEGVDIIQRAVSSKSLSLCDAFGEEDSRLDCYEAVNEVLEDVEPEQAGDADQDGLSDTAEVSLGTDPANPDSDNDGLTDGEEVEVFQTDPLNPDTDGDTFLDGTEVENGFDPNGAGSL